MELGKVFTDSVDIRGRHRPLSPEKVNALAESMKEIGLQQPISVWSPNEYECVLVAGYHRLEAAKKLGWSQIDCFFVDLNELDRELWEIDENLMRAELTPVQQAEHLKRRKEIWETKRVSAQLEPKPQGGRPEGFASETSKKTGVSKANINKAISRAEKIPEHIREKIEGTDLDTGAYMDSIKDMPEEEMERRVTEDIERGKLRRQIMPPTPEQKRQYIIAAERERLMRAWNAASEEVREWFVSEILEIA